MGSGGEATVCCPAVRAAMSSFWKIGDVTPGLARLERDLADGTWHRAQADLLERDSLDCGYRLIIAAPT